MVDFGEVFGDFIKYWLKPRRAALPAINYFEFPLFKGGNLPAKELFITIYNVKKLTLLS